MQLPFLVKDFTWKQNKFCCKGSEVVRDVRYLLSLALILDQPQPLFNGISISMIGGWESLTKDYRIDI